MTVNYKKKESKTNAKDLADQSKTALDTTLNNFIDLKNEVKASESIKKFLAMSGKMHSYSFSNMCLILAFKPDANFVLPYKKWQDIFKKTGSDKAFIKKGSGIPIRVPMHFKKDKEQSELDGSKQTSGVFFGVGYVFDISDVENFDYDPDEIFTRTVNEDSQEMTDLYNKAKEVFSKHSQVASISEKQLDPDLGGYARNTGLKTENNDPVSDIVLNESYTQADKFRVLIHEMAHALLHIGKNKDFESTDKKHLKSLFETEAESVSYAVSSHYGLKADDSLIYVATWEGDKDIAKASLERILKTSKLIIDLLEKEG